VTKEAVLFNADLPESGEWFLTASASDYAERNRILNLSESLAEINVYLPPDNKSVLNVIRVYDSSGSFYENTKLRLQKGSEVIEEKYLTPEHSASVYMLETAYYSFYLDNGQETRNIGMLKYDPDGYIDLYVTTLTIQPISYANVIYEINRDGGTITCEYSTISGTTTSAEFTVSYTNGTQAYYANATTPSGKFTFVGDANETYIVEFNAVNSYGNVTFSTIMYAESQLGTGEITAPTVGGLSEITPVSIKDIPSWERAMFFGGLCIFTALLFKRSHAPIGLMMSLSLLVAFTHLGYLSVDLNLLWVLAVIAALAFFERRRDKG